MQSSLSVEILSSEGPAPSAITEAADGLVDLAFEPVESAETVAALRALAQRETEPALRVRDPHAVHFLGRKRRLQLAVPCWITRAVIARMYPGIYGYIIARTRQLDRIVRRCLRDGVEQLVLLGAGYDTRAYRLPVGARNLRVFEVDLPGTQARKRACVEAAGLRTAAATRVTYVPLDLERRSLERALILAGYRLTRTSLFVAEGLFYYLHPATVDALVRCVARNARPGSSLAFDYLLQSFVDGDRSTYGASMSARWFARGDEPCLSGIEDDRCARYLSLRGFSLASELGPRQLERAFLTRDDGRRVQRSLGFMRVAHARVGP